MRCSLALSLLCVGATAASASTTITGGNIINQTWTVAGNPYIVEGDITIPSGTTLTIEAGVTVQLPTGDMQASGLSPTQTEITVDGTLIVAGTAAAPVTFAGASANAWYGVVVGATAASVQLEHAVITNPYVGITYGGSGNVMSGFGVDIESPTQTGLTVVGGSPSFDGLIVRGIAGTTQGGVAQAYEGTSLTLTNCLITDVEYGASAASAADAPGALSLTNCTIDRADNGVSISDYVTVTVVNSLITNGSLGFNVAVDALGDDITVAYTDAWNNSMGDLLGVACGSGCLSANPQYVSASDHHLQATSVAIDAGTTGPADDLDGNPRPVGARWDLGAYEYGSMAVTGSDAGVIPLDASAITGDSQHGDQPGDAGPSSTSGSNGGCCDAGGPGGGSLVLALAVGAVLASRRRRAR